MPPKSVSQAFSKVTIRTPRLILRPYRISDFEAWAKVRRERLPKQNEFDRGPPPANTLTKAYLAHWLKRSKKAQDGDFAFTLAVFDRKTGANVGIVNFAVLARLCYQFANLGYDINNQFWGQGYASEAVAAALPVAFKVLKLHRVEAGIQPHNYASITVAQKAGMNFESLRKKYYFDGKEKEWVDLVYYAANAEDFGFKMKPTVRPEWS